LTLRQTGKMTKPLPVVLYDEKFWSSTISFDSFVKAKLVSAKDLELFTFATTPAGAWHELKRCGLAIPKD
jgi:predicted Rossmann-fold nucleotide-binding protein